MIEPTAIDGLLVVRSPVHGDARGFFRETYRRPDLEAALGRPVDLVQGNHARSVAGTVRGFHAEPWDKLVGVARGTARCAVADLRPDSPTFGEVVVHDVGDAPGEHVRLFVAEGLGNAYAALTDLDYVYDVGGLWHPEVDKRAVHSLDPDLGVDWGVGEPLLSDDDRTAPTLRERVPEHPRWSADPA